MTTPETLPPPDIQVLTSNLCMPPKTLFLGSSNAYENHADIIGVDGYEVIPVRSRFLREVLSVAKDVKIDILDACENSEPYTPPGITKKYANLIKSAHGVFREEELLNGREPLSFRALPGLRESMGILDMFRYATGFNLEHFVLYARERDKPSDYRIYEPLFEDCSFQPKARDWKGLWRLRDGIDDTAAALQVSENDPYGIFTWEEEVRAQMLGHGFTSVTWDVFHAQVESKGGEKFEDPLLLSQRLSARGLVNAVHVAVNRQDCAQGNPSLARSTKEAQEAFVESTGAALETIEGKMLWYIVQDWKRMRRHSGAERFVVLEEAPEITLQASRIQDRQAAIVNSIRGIIARAN